MFKKFFWVGASLLVVIILAVAVYFGLDVFVKSSAKPVLSNLPGSASANTRVMPDTIIREEYEYLCGDVHIVYLGRAPEELVGLDMEELKKKYPSEDGWAIETSEMLVLKKKCREFCPEHKNYRHLGIYKGQLAVFEGPLGNNYKLLRVEKNIFVANLPVDYQIKLEQAMDFDRQLPEIQAQLREELEFVGDSAVYTVLENLDEHTKSPKK